MQPPSPATWPAMSPARLRQRQLAPEILDTLPEDSREAARARRDLRIFNRIMSAESWICRMVPRHARPGDRILELGAGTGDLARRLHRQGLDVDALDLWGPPADWPSKQRWYRGDAMEFDGWADYQIVIANLFLHHLSEEKLSRLGQAVQPHARVIIACEPARRRRFVHLFRLVCLLTNACAASRHDGEVSIAAGFSGIELAASLMLDGRNWSANGRVRGRGAYQFIAYRPSRLP